MIASWSDDSQRVYAADAVREATVMPLNSSNATDPDETRSVSVEVLVRECVEGNDAAWDALVDRYRNLIFSIPIKFGFPPEDAEEMFQEVCLKLLWALPALREPRALPAWLIRTTSRECVHWRRRQVRHRSLITGEYALSFEANVGLSAEIDSEIEIDQNLRECVAELSAQCRELVEMLFFTVPPVPYDEVAKRLGLALGSIGFVRMKCLERLRRRLESKGFAA